LREWIGARANIFFIAAEAGSGKTNLLAEIQKQYTERELPSLLIRAGRMEKQTLNQQIAYLLNIDFTKGLEDYTSISGTQAEPTFILIDGLNEANNAEQIWQEIIDLSKVFEPGSLKFVVTNRANSKADLERYVVSDSENDLLYGENNDNEKGLSAYTFWLTALDMKEMKNAWDNYAVKDKSRFKPNFSFDDIALFDRAIYNQINNPLVLRIFLEIYHGKPLPKKGNKHLNIWGDWLTTFSEAEQAFFKLLTDEIWDKSENELLLDDLINNEKLKSYFTTDVINAPYPRLKNNGWISRYVKDLNSYVAFTVEGALLYLLGVKLQLHKPTFDLAAVQEILEENNKLKRSYIESFLCRKSLEGDLKLVCELIDAGDKHIDICITPLLLFLKAFGPKAMLDIVLENPTENDWKVLLNLDEFIYEQQFQSLRKSFLIELKSFNSFQNYDSIILCLKSILVFDYQIANQYKTQFESSNPTINFNHEILLEIARCENKLRNYHEAIKIYQKCLMSDSLSLKENFYLKLKFLIEIGLTYKNLKDYKNSLNYYLISLELIQNSNTNHDLELSFIYGSIGIIYNLIGDYDKSIEYSNKSLSIRYKLYGEIHIKTASLYNNIGSALFNKGENDKALVFIKKSLDIKLKILDPDDISLAIAYNNIGEALQKNNSHEEALDFYNKSLKIKIKVLDDYDPLLATTQFNIGEVLLNLNKNEDALIFFQKSLSIQLKQSTADKLILANHYKGIGFCYLNLNDLKLCLESFHMSNNMIKTTDAIFGIAKCLESQQKKDIALKHYIESALVFKSTLNSKFDRNHYSIQNAIRIAKDLGKEDELPDWIKELKN